MSVHNNIAYIDGQNLYRSTMSAAPSWKIDLFKFREYLREKYAVKEAYYFLGCLDEDYQELYANLQRAGFIVVFREHTSAMFGKKKGNVDTDIVFSIMEHIADGDPSGKIVLVSGDGDYKKVVDYAIKKKRFLRILFPNGARASSLYNKVENKFKLSLSRETIKNKIMYLEENQ